MGKHLRKVQCKKRFFFHYFLVSLVLMLIVCGGWLFLKHAIYSFISHFYNITFKEFSSHVLCMMSLWRVLIIQFTLAPAIAFMCIEKHVAEHDDFDELH